MEIRNQPLTRGLGLKTILPRLVPVVHLQTDEDAENDNQRFDDDGEPVLLPDGGGEALEDHRASSFFGIDAPVR